MSFSQLSPPTPSDPEPSFEELYEAAAVSIPPSFPRDAHRLLVATGDGTNDIPMLEWADYSAAMRVAPEQVQACATHVTGSGEGDGSAAVLRALLDRL